MLGILGHDVNNLEGHTALGAWLNNWSASGGLPSPCTCACAEVRVCVCVRVCERVVVVVVPGGRTGRVV